MANESIQPQIGRRPVYPVDKGHGDGQREGAQPPEKKPTLPAPGAKDGPASDENTESADHPNDE